MQFSEMIQQHATSITLNKGEHVFHQGDSDSTLYFVKYGLLKAYYLSADGKETIKSFIKPANIIGSLSAAYKGLPCTFNLLGLTDCELLRFEFSTLQQAANENNDIATQLINVLMMHSIKKEQREYDFLMLSAEQRFQKFLKNEPELVNQLTQNDIAKYLGITPVALSRIKHRIQLD